MYNPYIYIYMAEDYKHQCSALQDLSAVLVSHQLGIRQSQFIELARAPSLGACAAERKEGMLLPENT